MKHLQSHQVWAYLDGEVDLQQRAELEDHLANCLVCRDKVHTLRRFGSALTQVLDDEVPKQAPGFHENLLAVIKQTANHDELAITQAACEEHSQETIRLVSSGENGTYHRGGGAYPGGRKARHARRQSLRGARSKRLLLSFSAAAGVVVAVGVGWYVLKSNTTGLPLAKTGNAVAVSGVGGSLNGNTRHGVGLNAPSRSLGLGQGNLSKDGANSLPANGGDLNQSQTQSFPGQTQPSLATMVVQTLTGQAKVMVQTSAGKPLSGAHVAYVCDGRILSTSVTGGDGATDTALLTIPADSVLAPTFSQPGFYPEGDLTVVVWKSGYRPVVSYDMRVFSGGMNEYRQTVSLEPANSSVTPEISGEGADTGTSGYHLLSLDAYVNWIKGAAGAAQSQSTGSSADKLSVAVTDEAGKPVVGAHVAVVAGSQVSSGALTGTDGNTPLLETTGVEDWRFVGPWNVNHLSPKIAAVVVWKDGYAPAIGLYVPVSSSQATHVTARLESLAWRQANHENNLDAPTALTPERKTTPALAQNYLNWVTSPN